MFDIFDYKGHKLPQEGHQTNVIYFRETYIEKFTFCVIEVTTLPFTNTSECKIK